MNIVITGATSGIGKTATEYFASQGNTVVMVARNNIVLEQLCSKYPNSIGIKYDLCDLNNIENIFLECKDRGIKLDGLVHCAGINRDMPVKVNDVAIMNQVFATNCLSFMELVKYFALKKYSNDGSAVIGMSSIAVEACNKSMSTYAASKAGLDAMVRVMAKEYAKRGIRVNSIRASFVDTPMTRSIDDFENKIASQPLGIIEPIQIAYLIEFLLSERSKYISGSNIKMSAAVI